MRRKLTMLTVAVVALVGVAVVALSGGVFTAEAGTLGATYIHLSRMETNVTNATTGVEMTVAFTPSQTFTANGTDEVTLVLDFPAADGAEWCRSSGTDLVVTGVTGTPDYVADNATSADITAPVAPYSTGSLTGECVSDGTNGDKIIISGDAGGLATLNNTDTYGVTIAESATTPTATLGTATTASTGTSDNHLVSVSVKQAAAVDTKTVGVFLVGDDTVDVTATVVGSEAINCSISSTSVVLGDLYQGGTFVTGTHDISTSTTSGVNGYYWTVYGKGDGTTAGLNYFDAGGPTNYTIESTATTVDLTSGSGFGLTASEPTGTTVETDFQTGTTGQFGGIEVGHSAAKMLLYRTTAQDVGTDTSTITYGARAGTSAEHPAATYTENVTFVCGGYY